MLRKDTHKYSIDAYSSIRLRQVIKIFSSFFFVLKKSEACLAQEHIKKTQQTVEEEVSNHL